MRWGFADLQRKVGHFRNRYATASLRYNRAQDASCESQQVRHVRRCRGSAPGRTEDTCTSCELMGIAEATEHNRN